MGNRWIRWATGAGALAAVALLSACEPAPPVLSLTVTTTVDAHDADPGDGVCEVTSGAGDCSLRAAVDEAGASTTQVQVSVPAGDYALSLPGDDDDNGGGDLDLVGAAGRVNVFAIGDVRVDAAGAAGVFDVRSGTATIVGFELTGATGPGVAVRSGAHADLVLDTVHGNGSGVQVDAGADALVHDATVAANGGAGLVNDGSVLARFATITGNGAGGVSGSGTTTTSAVVVGQQAAGADCVAPATLTSDHSADSDGSCGLTGTGDLAAADTQLAALDTSGSGLPLARPELGSPLVDAIAPGVAPCGDDAVDQTGRHRPVGTGCDIGAVEADLALHLTVDNPADVHDAAVGDGRCDVGDGSCTLRAAVDEANQRAVAGQPNTIDLAVDPTLSITGTGDDANATGDLDLVTATQLRGAGHRVDAAGIDRVLDVRADGVAIEDVTIAGGHVVAEDGGGIRHETGALTIRRSVVEGNVSQPETPARDEPSSASRGGGLAASGSQLVVDRSTFVGNVADNGGAIFHRAGTATVADSTFSDNVGGAYLSPVPFFSSVPAGASFTHVTVHDQDVAARHPAVDAPSFDYCNVMGCTPFPGAPVTVTASLFDAFGGGCGEVTSGGYNVGCGATASDLPGPATLGPLGDHGGSTPTRLPFAGSAGIDLIPLGAPGLCEAGTTDQRGEPRPDGPACDSGAVEGDNGMVLVPRDVVVDAATDARDDAPGDGVCHTAAGDCTLRAAVDETNAWPGADTIRIADGVDPVLARAGADEDHNATGDVDVTGELRIDGDGATIDGATLDRVLDALRPSVPFVVDDVTIRRGRVTGSGGAIRARGAITVTSADLVDNRATADGGAVSAPTVTVDSSELRDNRATGYGGGTSGGVVTITDSVLAANVAGNIGGGASADQLVVSGSTFEANSALSGGGAGTRGTAPSTIADSEFRANTVAFGGGGLATSGPATVERSTFEGNAAPNATWGTGGGIQSQAALTVRSSTIADNTAAVVGGGIAAQGGSLELTASTVDGNAAGTNGGAILLQGSATVSRSTITGNRIAGPGQGAGIGTPSSYPSLTISGSILANLGYDCWAVQPVSGGGNVARNCPLLNAPSDRPGVDPQLAPLQDNGGPTPTRLPYAGSPALDAIAPGTASLCDASSATDQRGQARPVGAGCDSGAVEGDTGTQPAPRTFTVDTADDALDADPTDGTCETATGTCSLRAAVIEANAWPAADTIVIGDGIDPTLTRTGLLEMASQTGDLDVYGDTTVEGGGASIHASAGDRAFHVLGGGALRLRDVTVDGPGPTEFALWDGALFYVEDGSLGLERSTVSGVTVMLPTIGGRAGEVRLEDSTVRDGAAGGIVRDQGELEITLVRSTVSGFAGDPIDGTQVDLASSTVVDNGGGIRAASGTWTASTIAGNDGGTIVTGSVGAAGSVIGGPLTCTTPIASGGYNLSQGTCGLSSGTDAVAADPLLGPLADNGGPTRTRLPFANSPALDAIPVGTPELCDAGATDQRGVARPVGPACDRGAVEGDTGTVANPLDLLVDSAADGSDAAPGDGVCATAGAACTLRAAIDEANAYPTADTITLAAGIDPVLGVAGRLEDANATGDLDVHDSVTVVGGGASVDGAHLDRVFDVHEGVLGLSDLSITGGDQTLDGLEGAAVRSASGLLLDRVTLTGNAAVRGTVGVVGGGATIQDSTFVGNHSTAVVGDGDAALQATGAAVVLVARSTFTNNAADLGAGAVGVHWNASVAIRQSTITGNTARQSAAVNVDSSTAATIEGSTVTQNLTWDPSGASVVGAVHVAGSIVDAGSGVACAWNANDPPTSGGYNVVSDDSCGFAASGDVASTAPLLGPLADNGGPTRTRLPYSGSPVLDAIPVGTVGLCDAAVPTDQRGAIRPAGAACDVGSVEGHGSVPSTPLALVVDSAADASDVAPGDGVCATAAATCTLRAAIDEANARLSPDTITVAAGVNPTLSVAGPDDDDNRTGDLDVNDSLTITGTGATVVSGAQLDRVLDIRGGTVTLARLAVRDGRLDLTGTTGGGIRSIGSAVTLDRVMVRNNRVGPDGRGGGLVVYGGSLSVQRSTIASNVSTGFGSRAGGIYGVGATIEVADSTLSNNQGFFGAAAMEEDGAGSLTIRRSTIAANNGSNHLWGVTLQATIVDAGAQQACGGVLSLGFNLVSDTTCLLDATGDVPGADALLGALSGNGGSTLTRLPGAGSPAIDAIPTGTVGVCDASTPVDQRGVARPQGAACDIGAVEQ